MKRSENRILTTHVGSLPRPKDLIELYQQDAPDVALLPRLKSAVADIVKQQVEAGVDVVDDGEFGKACVGPWIMARGGLTFTIDLTATKLARHRPRKVARGGRLEVKSARSSRNSMRKTAGWGPRDRPEAPVPPGYLD